METGENTQVMTEKMRSFAGKGTANTALGLGIAGTVLGLGAMGLFGARGQNGSNPSYVSTREFYDYALVQADKRFEDYKSVRDLTDSLLEKINDINAKVEVAAATVPLTVAAEAAARKAADTILVSYINGNFQPVEIADLTVGTGATVRPVYNPLIALGMV